MEGATEPTARPSAEEVNDSRVMMPRNLAKLRDKNLEQVDDEEVAC